MKGVVKAEEYFYGESVQMLIFQLFKKSIFDWQQKKSYVIKHVV